MGQGIEYLVKRALEDKGFELDYDPQSGKYRPWWRVPFKVSFPDRGGVGFGFLPTRKISIPTKGVYYTIDSIAGGLLHEAGHVDILPIEAPLLIYGGAQALNHFDDPLRAFAASIAIAAVYSLLVRELIVDGYNCAKHGMKYLRLAWFS